MYIILCQQSNVSYGGRHYRKNIISYAIDNSHMATRSISSDSEIDYKLDLYFVDEFDQDLIVGSYKSHSIKLLVVLSGGLSFFSLHTHICSDEAFTSCNELSHFNHHIIMHHVINCKMY